MLMCSAWYQRGSLSRERTALEWHKRVAWPGNQAACNMNSGQIEKHNMPTGNLNVDACTCKLHSTCCLLGQSSIGQEKGRKSV
eukprot:1126099-Amphidinium_carterae.1